MKVKRREKRKVKRKNIPIVKGKRKKKEEEKARKI